ncbi:PBSX family phage terminase large subunit [Paenibacillus sp. SC116]|uniref:PBSX family phage terminase large subunit n=1 Tax=Paenibacillus sp. SC116 TaxID=2968986 RepID=UPI00215A1632|nr:PBSX family phage terminase large subunit [Paenibacillus sp. SC116]
MMTHVTMSSLIAPHFYSVHHDIKEELHTHYWLKGGRGSTKSSFVSIETIKGMMEDPLANAMAIRKVKQTLRESVFEQYVWAIERLQVSHLWDIPKSKLELTYLPTGQKIWFRGADNVTKLKSTKLAKGYFKYVWYEEVDEFAGMEEIRSINQSLLRGGTRFVVFYSFNPPQTLRHWLNAELTETRQDRLIHHSTYLSVPDHWLGKQFVIEAEHLQATRPDRYEHEYMGAVTGSGGEVFRNISFRTVSDEEISAFDRVKRGLDFGYANDPSHYTVCHYDKTRRRLYIFYEVHKTQMSNKQLVEHIREENKLNQSVTADSAEPRTINELKGHGLRVTRAVKGPDSVAYGIKFLQDLEEIVIDPIRCPNTKREFYQYELKPDGNGGYKAGYSDKDNHSIDAVRYALEDEMNRSSITILR